MLKLGDYLSVQAHKPCSISHLNTWEYLFLEVVLFLSTKTYVAEQVKRVSYSLLNKVKTMSLRAGIQIDLIE